MSRAAARVAGTAGHAALIAASAAPGLALAPAYVDPVLVGGLLAGWAAAAVLLTTALRRTLGAPATLLAGLVVALSGVAVLARFFPGPERDLARAVLDAVVNSGARILTTSLPTEMAVDTLALPALAVWLSGSAAALAVRAGYPLAGMLCPLLALAGAAVLNGPELAPAYFPAALFALSAVVVLAVAARTPSPEELAADVGPGTVVPIAAADRAGRVGRALPRALSLGGVLALVAALTTYLGPLALYGTPIRPADPRAAVSPPEEETQAVSPLSYLAGWTEEPGHRLMTVTSPEPTELRWVTLSHFDGVTWQPEGRYRPSSEVLPDPEQEVPDGPERAIEVEVEELPGHWLPTAGIPERITGTPVAVQPASATLRTRQGDAAGLTYRVRGQVPEYDRETLRAAEEADREAFADYLALPEGAPPEIHAIADAFADGTPYERANWLAAHLRANYGVDPEAPGGHGYANLEELLVPPSEKGGGGTSGQFASAFALLARASGLPSRVVVGFGPGTPAGDGGDERIIRSGDALAWGEVYLEGVGWAPFDVLPGDPKRNGVDQGGEGGEGGGTAGQAAGGTESEEDRGFFRVGGAPLDVGYAWSMAGRTSAGVVAALVLAALLSGAVRGTRRGLRLGARDPRRRLAGAWWELRDGLRLAGAPPRPSDTVTDVLDRSDHLLPPEGGGRRDWTLGRTLNAMAFVPAEERAAGLDADSAERAAEEVRAYTAALRRRLPRVRRVLWWLDPRPLFWRRR
ncbi:transglutaminase family protein [Streptomonospora nanhaiensis]|uniref:transglutaminase family protein n=1 Tax=Streptomonospora nanhaiensis TaxID=1323731 RepID=UPI001C387771|nr:transglutaminase domain-containing protein [Streptomonospora nanhaiensis]MBV2365742.1 DUF3488 and transglutaminase-like domain-containing protein [Streptomonospora nanhaiensis]